MTDSEADPLEGTPYHGIAPLGSGGMGEVWEAEHRGLRRRVVVKLLQQPFARRPDLEDRIRLEAQALAVLSDPHIVAVNDLGETPDGRPYLVMERLHGRTLGAELRERGVLPVIEAVDLVRQALAGLGAAHAAGIVHRDIKPENLFLCDTRPRVLKLLDFGVAKVMAGAGERAPAPLCFPTEEGTSVGTPRFIAPEQVFGGPIDGRADLYAAALVLYTLLAGRGPFDHHNSFGGVLKAHALELPLPPSRVAPQPVAPELDRVILKALEKRPGNRFATAAEMSEALERAVHQPVARWLRTERMAPVAVPAGRLAAPVEVPVFVGRPGLPVGAGLKPAPTGERPTPGGSGRLWIFACAVALVAGSAVFFAGMTALAWRFFR